MRVGRFARRTQVDLFAVFDEWIDDVDLLPALDRLAQGLAHARALTVANQQVCASVGAPGGSSSITERSRSPCSVSASVRGIGVAVITSVWGDNESRRLLGQRGTLPDTEAVLFVDHHQRKALEHDTLLHQRVSSDREVDLARGNRAADRVGLAPSESTP